MGRRDHLLAGGRRLQHRRAGRQGAGRRAPRLGDALPVRQPRQRRCALRHHRTGDPGRPADDHPLRRGPGHHRHPHGRRPLPAREGPRRRHRRRGAALRRPGLRAAQPRRGLRARAVRRVRAHHPLLGRLAGRGPPHPRTAPAGGHLRRRLHRRRPARGPGRRRQGRQGRRAGRRRLRRRRRRLEVPVDRHLHRTEHRGRGGRAARPALGLSPGPPEPRPAPHERRTGGCPVRRIAVLLPSAADHKSPSAAVRDVKDPPDW
ncbi:hypothetical protein SCOCK_20401 [Actinacidiphila cocklensis]|uniref:Uncharacterized protein n=1 Tax=Actinacidiphila cocklensis TaxID=887465 RepID=A0A9W4DTR2_9ACTN|nr:hypothetical protein SCOCK_20401 [Actinacidiphila cocklensis]